ncbi:MAG: phosphoenolpyruvate--protein phosphotransferase [Pirellulaceae bacterium]
MTNPASSTSEVHLQGVSICPGVAVGYVRARERGGISIPQEEVDLEEVATEQERYSRAVEVARRHLPEHVATAHGPLAPEAKAIFHVHEAILADESFHSHVRNCIAAQRKRAEFCLNQEAAAVIARLEAMRDPYFKARSEDIRDMAYNLLGVLSSGDGDSQRPLTTEDVVVSRYLHPSCAFMVHRAGACGFASESQALASHAAILLKGFAVPSVGAVSGLVATARDGDRVIVDGNTGVVVVRPSSRTETEYVARQQVAETPAAVRAPEPCRTADGTTIVLRANIENPDQIQLVLTHALDGIGLFRTEFMISSDGRVPTEDEQYAIYRRVCAEAAGRLVVFRTFDLGADKQFGLTGRCAGANPALGVRGIRRHLMDESAELGTQLRAILRAACGNDVSILIPMVTTKSDVVRAKRILAQVEDELRANGIELPRRIVLGAMIEVPAAAVSVRRILPEVDFISLGTNDLLQYFMAADRDNERVVQYQDPTDPAFLWLLEHIIDQAAKAGRQSDVGVCGEIASDPTMLPHLLRLGYRSLSITPVAAGTVRDVCAKARTY